MLHAVAASMLAATVGLAIETPARADNIRDLQWHLSFLEIAKAQAISQGEGITVAVIDSGIDNNHPDMTGNVLTGLDVVVGGSGNGWGDKLGHGTGMAGLIAAHGHGAGNKDGALGLAPKAKILPIRIETGSGYGDGKALAKGVDEAVSRGAKIITVPVNSDANSFDAVQRAVKAGVIVVASTGNRPRENFIGDPAAHPGVVAVGAVDKEGNIAEVSVRGPAVSLVAPGVDIVSASNDDGYRKGTGTSPSTAIVSGAAALVWAKYPKLTSTQVVEHLTKTATDKGAPGRDNDYGFGVLNVLKALTTEPSTAPTASPTQSFQNAPIIEPSDPEPKSNLVLWGTIAGVALIVVGLVVLVSRRRSASR
ncbi:type VII secretion-associated serine protease [Rhizocola hellebori]|uniref:Type VII secretion-associated serine protease n=1 Tax=Rhizocola hellebori TaxID=1392758 RepID=A0A8J3QH41_9ACTN|nr:type VII secretion-associated serine protease [Rhizocola hellebori]